MAINHLQLLWTSWPTVNFARQNNFWIALFLHIAVVKSQGRYKCHNFKVVYYRKKPITSYWCYYRRKLELTFFFGVFKKNSHCNLVPRLFALTLLPRWSIGTFSPRGRGKSLGTRLLSLYHICGRMKICGTWGPGNKLFACINELL